MPEREVEFSEVMDEELEWLENDGVNGRDGEKTDCGDDSNPVDWYEPEALSLENISDEDEEQKEPHLRCDKIGDNCCEKDVLGVECILVSWLSM